MPVTVRALDEKGREVPTANMLIQFSVKGNGQLIGVGNGEPNSHELEKVNQRSLFNGLAQVIVQAGEDTTPIELVATTRGLKPFTLRIPVNKVPAIPSVPAMRPIIQLTDWRMSPFSDTKPNPTQEIADNDMNSWSPVKAGQLMNMDRNFVLLRTTFSVTGTAKAQLLLKQVSGKAEVWLNNQLVFTKTGSEPGDITFPVPRSTKSYKLVVLLGAEKSRLAGLGGVVTLFY